MIVSVLAIVSTVLTTPPTLERACDPEDKTSCVQPLLEGETAPFSGQLLTPRRAAKLGVRAGDLDERVRLAIEETAELWRIKLEKEQALRKNDNEANAFKLDLLTKAVDRPFYEHPLFVAAATVAGCVAVYFVAVETVKATK